MERIEMKDIRKGDIFVERSPTHEVYTDEYRAKADARFEGQLVFVVGTSLKDGTEFTWIGNVDYPVYEPKLYKVTKNAR